MVEQGGVGWGLGRGGARFGRSRFIVERSALWLFIGRSIAFARGFTGSISRLRLVRAQDCVVRSRRQRFGHWMRGCWADWGCGMSLRKARESPPMTATPRLSLSSASIIPEPRRAPSVGPDKLTPVRQMREGYGQVRSCAGMRTLNPSSSDRPMQARGDLHGWGTLVVCAAIHLSRSILRSASASVSSLRWFVQTTGSRSRWFRCSARRGGRFSIQHAPSALEKMPLDSMIR